jgi:hypothetical protein
LNFSLFFLVTKKKRKKERDQGKKENGLSENKKVEI